MPTLQCAAGLARVAHSDTDKTAACGALAALAKSKAHTHRIEYVAAPHGARRRGSKGPRRLTERWRPVVLVVRIVRAAHICNQARAVLSTSCDLYQAIDQLLDQLALDAVSNVRVAAHGAGRPAK